MDARIQRLVETHDLKTNKWNMAAQKNVPPFFTYNERVDALMLMIADPKTKKVTHYLDEQVALLYEMDTREIIGIRIEAFGKVFLPKYAGLQEAWRLSDACKLEDISDLMIALRKQERLVVREISKVTQPIVEQAGIKMPVFA